MWINSKVYFEVYGLIMVSLTRFQRFVLDSSSLSVTRLLKHHYTCRMANIIIIINSGECYTVSKIVRK